VTLLDFNTSVDQVAGAVPDNDNAERPPDPSSVDQLPETPRPAEQNGTLPDSFNCVVGSDPLIQGGERPSDGPNHEVEPFAAQPANRVAHTESAHQSALERTTRGVINEDILSRNIARLRQAKPA
jgi:hypothetical protein